MSYTLEELGGCRKKLIFQFDSVDLTTEVSNFLKGKQKDAQLKGFRKGKAPLSVIEQMYGPQAQSEALSRFIQKEFVSAIENEKLMTVGYPHIENTNYEEEAKKISFDAIVETYPEFEVADLSKLKFEKEKVEVTEDDVKQLEANYLQSKSSMKAIEDKDAKLEQGQFSVINFEGEKEDGERPANMKADEYLLEIGSNSFIPGFEEGLVGMKVGEKRAVELTFPEDYHEPSLKNAKVTFHTELLEIKTKEMPELDDELAKEFGFESAEDFKTKNKETITAQKDRQVQENLHQQILEKLIEENKFDVPAAMLAEQRKYVEEDVTAKLKQQGFNDQMLSDYVSKWDDDLNQKAEFQVRSGLILNKLAEKYNVEVNESDLEGKYAEMAKQSGLEIDKVKEYYGGNENIKKNLMYALKEERTFAKIKEEATVTEK